ncbi:MAG: serine hydrolase [Pirellulales bacterium]|nr:serine hydrolase [Pirellulales bacterium]
MKRYFILSMYLYASLALSEWACGNTLLSHFDEPASVGIDEAALADAVSIIRDSVDGNEIPGAVILVARRGKVVLHQAFGYRDIDEQVRLQKDSLFRMASNSKALTAAGVLVLVDDGLIDLDEPIGTYLPAFANESWQPVTIRHLLTHTSGSPIDRLFITPLLPRDADKYPNRLIAEVNRFANTPLKESPGNKYSYNNAGYNILAAMIEKITGSYKQHLRQRIYEPIGMLESCNHESDADNARMSTVFVRQEDGSWKAGWKPHDPPNWPFPRGSGGMVSSALDYTKFCQMLLGGGVYNGKRVLSKSSVREMTGVQVERIPAAKNYGLGWKVSEKNGVFSHTGSDGTYVFVDPVRELIGMVLTQTNGTTRPRENFRVLVQRACKSGIDRSGEIRNINEGRFDGFYKDIFMDGGKYLTSRKTLHAANSLTLSYEYYAGTDQSKQNELLIGSDYDTNGVLLYPDGQPRFKMLYVNGGGATRHGESLTANGLDRIREFYFNGGSYCGSCAGSFFSGRNVDSRTEPRESYLNIFPYNTFNTGMKNVRVAHVLPKGSPLLSYRQFGANNRVDDIYHNNGNWLPTETISSSMKNVEILATYDKPGHKVDGGAAIWAYKQETGVGRIVNIGCHPEGSESGDKLLLTESSFLYALDGVGTPMIKSHLELNQVRKMDQFSQDNQPQFARIGGFQYHHFTFTVPPSSFGDNQRITIELKSNESTDLHLYLARESMAFRKNATHMATGRQDTKQITRKLTPGLWHASVFCAKSVDAIEDSVAGFYRTIGDRSMLQGLSYSIEVRQGRGK